VHADAALAGDEQAQVVHFRVVLAGRVDRGPDGHHQLDAELVEFGHHRGGVGPVLRVELPVALAGPVEAAVVRQEEGDGHLGVALDQLDDRALLVEQAVLVLAEPVAALPLASGEKHLELVHASAYGLVPARRRPGEVRRRLGQELFAGRAGEPELARGGDLAGQAAVGDAGRADSDLDGGPPRLDGTRPDRARLDRGKRAGHVIADLLPQRPAAAVQPGAQGIEPSPPGAGAAGRAELFLEGA
jgi:hypothetical protein